MVRRLIIFRIYILFLVQTTQFVEPKLQHAVLRSPGYGWLYVILIKIILMKRGVILFIILMLSAASYSQVKVLQDYIEKGHNFQEICKKAEKMIKKNKLDEEEYREHRFRKGEASNERDFLDDEKLKFERWKWYWRDRVLEDGSFPDLGRQWALYKQIKVQCGLQSRVALNWKHEGPVRNTGGYWGMGRTTHVSFHPTQANTFYVASPNGGIWKTLDGGKTYTSIAEDLPYQPVGIVLVDPMSPNTIYATLGEKEGWWQYSMGVYKTTNGGASWTATGLNWKLTDNKVIYALEMNPENHLVLIAATSDGIYKTFNGGNSWTRIRTENYSDVKYKPGDTSIVYAALNDYWGTSNVFKSTDGGNNFQKTSDFGLQKVFLKFATTLANPEYLGVNMSVDGARRLYLSSNSGQSFEYISDMPENLVLYFSQTNASIVYCGSVVIYKSTNGGKDWTQITNWWNAGNGLPEVHADHHFITHHPLNKNDLFFSCDGGVYRYHENTGQWDELVNGLPVTQFYKMDISMTNPPVLIGGSQDNGGWLRRANGSWGNTNGGDAMSQVIDPSNANIGYTEYWGGNAVYRTTNGFNDLTDITPNIGAELPGQWVTPFSLNPQNPKTFIIGYNEIFVSHDRGNSFRQMSKNLTLNKDNDLRDVRICPTDTNFVVATRANTMYLSYDFGKTWKTQNLITNLEITGIAFHPRDSNRLWCTRGAYGAIKVMSSTNKGASWSNITRNMVNTPVLCIVYDEPSNTLFLGTDFGVFYSDADTIDWQYYGSGMPHTSVTDLKIHPTLRKLYAGTYGRGFYSIDLPDCAPSNLQMFVSVNGQAFASTDSVRVCAGSQIQFKSQDHLKGEFHWKGPRIDTTIFDSNVFTAGLFNVISQNGNYVLEYTSQTGCKRVDTINVRILNRPNFTIRPDGPHLDCRHSSLLLNPGMKEDTVAFAYEWSGPVGFQSLGYLAQVDQAGRYYLYLVNRSGNCGFLDSIDIEKFENPVIDSVDVSPNVCHGDSLGWIEVYASKGKSPLLFHWETGAKGSRQTGLKAGKYAITVEDANQCTTRDTFEIVEPEAYQVDFQIQASSGSDGSITTTIQGNNPPYRFEWLLGNQFISSSQNPGGLAPGSYTLVVLDSKDCSFSKMGIIVPEAVRVSHSESGIVSVFPNPVKDQLKVSSNKENLQQAQYRVSDFQGKQFSVPILNKNEAGAILDVSRLPKAVYVLRVYVEDRFYEFGFTKQ